MRIFLAPLFYKTRFCRHCAKNFYEQNPDGWLWMHELRRMPPLGRFEAGRGFIPDFSVLLMFDEFIVDGEAYESLRSSSTRPWMGAWPEVLRMLAGEGTLSTIDTDEKMKELSAVRGGMLRRDLRHLEKWVNPMRYHDNLMLAAETAFEERVDLSSDLKWEFDKDRGPFFGGADKRFHTRAGALVVPDDDDPNSFHQQMHAEAIGFLKWQLGEVNTALAIAQQLDAVPMLWAPYGDYMRTKALGPELGDGGRREDASRLFFKVAFPRYRPESVRELAKLRSDKRVRQLREVIIAAAETGETMDPQYPQRVLEEVLKIEKRIGRIRQISGWISSAIGCIPIPFLGLGATATAEVISKRVERSLRRDFELVLSYQRWNRPFVKKT